jgi:hypothetical protein
MACLEGDFDKANAKRLGLATSRCDARRLLSLRNGVGQRGALDLREIFKARRPKSAGLKKKKKKALLCWFDCALHDGLVDVTDYWNDRVKDKKSVFFFF